MWDRSPSRIKQHEVPKRDSENICVFSIAKLSCKKVLDNIPYQRYHTQKILVISKFRHYLEKIPCNKLLAGSTSMLWVLFAPQLLR